MFVLSLKTQWHNKMADEIICINADKIFLK